MTRAKDFNKDQLLTKALKKQVQTLFQLFDEDKTGFILQANLAKVVDDLNMRDTLAQEDIRKILLCCSSRGDRISFNEFHLIMTR